MADIRCWRIEGRVQGVFFRCSTRRQAESLGLTGHAINQSDGTVEVLACGELDALNALEGWLQKGPPAARVDLVLPQQVTSTDVSRSFTTG
ncbi:MAG: acylphosphatase [Pseudomonadota bacterium]